MNTIIQTAILVSLLEPFQGEIHLSEAAIDEC